MKYSIGIVTYIRRFKAFFKPLIQSLCSLFPDTEILVAINGYYDGKQQEQYLLEIRTLLARFPNVKVLPHTEAQSLSKLWNKLIIHSSNDKVLIFNDDILILPHFRKELEKCGILSVDVGLLKWSWSHFAISKKVISRFGWFDERFPGVGNEDEDYEARLAMHGVLVPSFSLSALRHIVVKTKDFSYGKNMAVVNQKYTSGNKLFFDSKWDLAEQPAEGFLFVRVLGKYAKLKQGMETPDFYPKYAKEESSWAQLV
ncbi:MAG: glycosyltransferase family 2 protein [Gammaproteobacteria bacterium]